MNREQRQQEQSQNCPSPRQCSLVRDCPVMRWITRTLVTKTRYPARRCVLVLLRAVSACLPSIVTVQLTLCVQVTFNTDEDGLMPLSKDDMLDPYFNSNYVLHKDYDAE